MNNKCLSLVVFLTAIIVGAPWTREDSQNIAPVSDSAKNDGLFTEVEDSMSHRTSHLQFNTAPDSFPFPDPFWPTTTTTDLYSEVLTSISHKDTCTFLGTLKLNGQQMALMRLGEFVTILVCMGDSLMDGQISRIGNEGIELTAKDGARWIGRRMF